MKNVMVFISPERKLDPEAEILAKVQIDNSLELGWARQDIIFVTNFPYEWNGVKALVISDDAYCSFCPPVSKINAILKLFEMGLVGDELYWFHDLDAFQQEKFTEAQVNLDSKDMGVCNYGRVPMWAAGTIFFKKSALVIFLAIQKLCYEWKVTEQKALRSIAGSSFDDDEHRPVLGRWVKTMNITYNFNTTNMDSNYRQAEKPLKVLHFHLTPRFIPAFLTNRNKTGRILATERFRNILARYGITGSERNIAIYAKPSYLKINRATGQPYLFRISSRVRGEEISQYLGAKLNTERTADDLCIFVKPRHLNYIKDGDYVDALDDIALIPQLKERPKIKVIAMSQVHYEYLKKELANEIFLIHHHHINFERFRRTRNNILTGGVIGHSPEAVELYNQFKKRFAEVGIEYLGAFNYQTRQDMLDFFKKIDFLVTWWGDYDRNCVHSHPTKIINAASFGIPALSQSVAGYKEFAGFYIPIEDIDSLVKEAVKLKDPAYYQIWSDKVYQEAEKYHISRIAELYKQLK